MKTAYIILFCYAEWWFVSWHHHISELKKRRTIFLFTFFVCYVLGQHRRFSSKIRDVLPIFFDGSVFLDVVKLINKEQWYLYIFELQKIVHHCIFLYFSFYSDRIYYYIYIIFLLTFISVGYIKQDKVRSIKLMYFHFFLIRFLREILYISNINVKINTTYF